MIEHIGIRPIPSCSFRFSITKHREPSTYALSIEWPPHTNALHDAGFIGWWVIPPNDSLACGVAAEEGLKNILSQYAPHVPPVNPLQLWSSFLHYFTLISGGNIDKTPIISLPDTFYWVPPDTSSLIRGHAHCAVSNTLFLQFSNGAVYLYLGVSSFTYAAFKDSPSLGKYFNQAIKGVFSAEALENLPHPVREIIREHFSQGKPSDEV